MSLVTFNDFGSRLYTNPANGLATTGDKITVVGPAVILRFGVSIVTATSGTDGVLKMDSVKAGATRGDGDIGELTVADYAAGTCVYKNLVTSNPTNPYPGFYIAAGDVAVLELTTAVGAGTGAAWVEAMFLPLTQPIPTTNAVVKF